MELLYSNILPLGTSEEQRTITECFIEQLNQADRVEIAVGYVSNAALNELEVLISKHNIQKVCLNIGMYFIEGMPENSYHTAVRINRKWMEDGIGEIRLIKAFKYHGKLYCFYKDGKPISAIIGSANLGVLKQDAANRRQYEIASFVTEQSEAEELALHIEKLKTSAISANIGEITEISLIRGTNTALTGVEFVSQVPKSNVDFYRNCPPSITFELRLKVPKYEERQIDDNKHFTKSNINVCYAAPRNKHKSRDWYETQLTVGADVYQMPGYPQKNVPFFVVTDDGYWFKAHTTSDNNKQFSAVGDELIMGRWLKGRLAAAGLVTPVNDTQLDTNRTGMITQEMLNEYGCDSLTFAKTGQTALDKDGTALDIWFLSFGTAKEDGAEL